MKEPRMTTPGKRRRCEMSASIIRMKITVKLPTAIPKGKILQFLVSNGSVVSRLSPLAHTFPSLPTPDERPAQNSPRYAQLQRILHHDKTRKHPNQHPARSQHNNDPEIQLLIRPVVALPHDHPRARNTAGTATSRHCTGILSSVYVDVRMRRRRRDGEEKTAKILKAPLCCYWECRIFCV